MNQTELLEQNKRLSSSSVGDAIEWALSQASRPVITTNFRPYEVAILAAVVELAPEIPVVWCDTGYNTPQTYKHAEVLIEKLNLNVQLYVPQQTAAHRNVIMQIPGIDDPRHAEFTRQVKLEPFQRAMKEHNPDVWFTNLRKGQTALRDTLDVLSMGKDGKLKVSPFYNHTDAQLDEWLDARGLPNEHTYYDPTKVLANRECGLHS